MDCRPRDRSLRASTALAQAVPAASIDDVPSVGVSIRRLVLAQQSRAPLMPGEARALLRAGFADREWARRRTGRAATFSGDLRTEARRVV